MKLKNLTDMLFFFNVKYLILGVQLTFFILSYKVHFIKSFCAFYFLIKLSE